jgi:hypothetical protein
MSPAISTISGNGSSSAKMATKAPTAMDHSHAFFSARDPTRQAACTTRAVTAGLMP